MSWTEFLAWLGSMARSSEGQGMQVCSGGLFLNASSPWKRSLHRFVCIVFCLIRRPGLLFAILQPRTSTSMAPRGSSSASMVVLAAAMLDAASAFPGYVQPRAAAAPFAPIDAQNWVNPDNMTWDDFVAPPSTSWSDGARKGRDRNFNIAMVTVDYPGR